MGRNNGTGLKLTPPSEFRKLREAGYVVELESTGRVVKLRPVNPTRLLRSGDIPDHLSGAVAKLVWGGAEEDERSEAQKAQDWLAYLETIAQAALLYPRIGTEPLGEDEIAIEDLTQGELIDIERHALKPLEAVRSFRDEQKRAVDAAS